MISSDWVMDFKIYHLSSNGEVFYVGLTSANLTTRLRGHMYGMNKPVGYFDSDRTLRIKEFIAKGQIIEITELLSFSSNKEGAIALEKEYILKYHRLGFKLTNYIYIRSHEYRKAGDVYKSELKRREFAKANKPDKK